MKVTEYIAMLDTPLARSSGTSSSGENNRKSTIMDAPAARNEGHRMAMTLCIVGTSSFSGIFEVMNKYLFLFSSCDT
jgi:hypothetical protein